MKRGALSEKFETHYPVYYDNMGYTNITGFIRELKPDLLHAGPGGGRDLEYISKAARLVPVTQTIMCPRTVSNYNDVVASVVPSAFVFSLQPRKKNVVHIHHPFDITDYSIKYRRDHFGLPEDKIIIGLFGNKRRENVDFLKIARYYKNKNVHFIIKTDKKYGYLFGRKRITRIKKDLTEDEKLSLVSCFDIFLYPTSNEAYGVVFLEAMSQKVPIISYDDSANREVIGEGGLLAPLHDIKKMMRLLDRLVKDKEERKRIGLKGHKLFLKRNDPKLIAKKYEAFFENVLKNN